MAQGRRQVTWVALGATAIVVAGFGRSYFFKVAFDRPPLSPLLHVHGVVMSAWLVVFIVQAQLAVTRRLALHRRLGLVGMGLAALVVGLGTAVAVAGARPATPASVAFLSHPLLDLAVFSALVAVGWVARHRGAVHGRVMVLAELSILAPALARLPLPFPDGPWAVFALQDVMVLAFVASDVVVSRRLHVATALGALLIIVAQPLRVALGAWEPWLTVVTTLL